MRVLLVLTMLVSSAALRALADTRRQYARLEGDVARLAASTASWHAEVEALDYEGLDERVMALEAAEHARRKGLPAPRTRSTKKDPTP